MSEFLRASSKIAFAGALALSWLGMTTILLLSAWQGERTFAVLSQWGALWFFAVAAPTIQAFRLRRALRRLLALRPDLPEGVHRDLRQTPFALLTFGSMALLLAFGLGLGR